MADVLASGTEAEMKAELKARKTPAEPRLHDATVEIQLQPKSAAVEIQGPKPKASGKRKAEAVPKSTTQPTKKQTTRKPILWR